MRRPIGRIGAVARQAAWIGVVIASIAGDRANAEMVTVRAADLPPGSVDQDGLPGVKVQRHLYSYYQPPAPVPPTIIETFSNAAVGQMPGNVSGPAVFGSGPMSGNQVARFTSSSYPRGYYTEWFWLEFASPTDHVSIRSLGENGISGDPTDYQVNLFGYDESRNVIGSTGWIQGAGLFTPVALELDLASADIKYAEVRFTFGEYNSGYIPEFSFSAVPEASSLYLIAATVACVLVARRRRP